MRGEEFCANQSQLYLISSHLKAASGEYYVQIKANSTRFLHNRDTGDWVGERLLGRVDMAVDVLANPTRIERFEPYNIQFQTDMSSRWETEP